MAWVICKGGVAMQPEWWGERWAQSDAACEMAVCTGYIGGDG